MLLIEFSRSEVDPSSLSNENKYHYLGIQSKYRKGKVEYRVPSAISAWISQRCIIVIFKLFKKVWRTTKTSHLPFYLFSVNKKLTFASDSWWKKSIQSAEVPGGGLPYEIDGMLVVSLRGVNFGFWSRLGCSGQSANILSRQGLV